MGLFDHPFWEDPGFWANFYSDLIVGVGIAIVLFGSVRWLVSTWGRPKPEAHITLEQTVDSPSPRRLYFRIGNAGKIAFRAEEIRWELFIPTSMPQQAFTNGSTIRPPEAETPLRAASPCSVPPAVPSHSSRWSPPVGEDISEAYLCSALSQLSSPHHRHAELVAYYRRQLSF
jgi:hypothetical protein